jgi:hypothetical protein
MNPLIPCNTIHCVLTENFYNITAFQEYQRRSAWISLKGYIVTALRNILDIGTGMPIDLWVRMKTIIMKLRRKGMKELLASGPGRISCSYFDAGAVRGQFRR